MDISTLGTPIEIRDATLGRMLFARQNVGTTRKTWALLKEAEHADQFASEYFAAIARSVSDDAPISKASYESGAQLSVDQFLGLNDAARDAISAAYLAGEPELSRGPIVPASVSDEISAQPPEASTPERQTETFAKTVRRYHTINTEALNKALRDMRGASAVEATMASLTSASALVRDQLASVSLPNLRALPGQAALDSILAGLPGERSRLALEAALPGATAAQRMLDSISGAKALGDVSMTHLADSIQKQTKQLGHILPSELQPVPMSLVSRPLDLSLPPNPILKTNKTLEQVQCELDKLVTITNSQAQLTQSLFDTAKATLQQAITYGKEARDATRYTRIGVWVAMATLVISIVIAIWATLDNRASIQSLTNYVTQRDSDQAMTERELRDMGAYVKAEQSTNADMAKRIDSLIKSNRALEYHTGKELTPGRPKKEN
jgi:hypothetical protein